MSKPEDNGEIAECLEQDLLTLPAGTYRTEASKVGRIYDIYRDEFHEGPLTLYAAIREVGPIPEGLEEVVIRPDGMMILKQWQQSPVTPEKTI